MIIKRIYINGFGRLKDLSLELSDGINIITGPNEAGKSTIHLFIRSMLYGAGTRRRGKERPVWERMRPWHGGEKYGGSIDIEKDGKIWRIERDFNRAADDLRIRDAESGDYLEEGENDSFMVSLMDGLSETAYANTVSAGQLQTASGRDMAAEIRRYAANVSSTMDPSLSADGALSILEAKRRKEQEKIDENALREYNRVLTRIKAAEEELKDPKKNNRIREIKKDSLETEEMAEDTALKLGDKELVISNYRAELNKSGLRDMGDVDRLWQDAEGLYDNYRNEKKALPVYIGAALFGVAAGILGIISAKAGLFGISGLFGNNSRIQIIIAVAALICGMGAFITSCRLAHKKDKDCKELNRLLAEHLDDKKTEKPDESSMQAFSDRIKYYRENAARLSEAKKQRDGLVSELQKLNDEQNEYSLKLREQEKIKAAVDEALRELISLRAKKEELKKRINENERHRDEIEAIDMACDTITQLSERIREAAGTYVNREAGIMINGFTEGRYDSISAGTDFDIKLNSGDGMIDVNELSQGTADQVYMAIRIAAIRFIAGSEDNIPLFLDDSFSQYDDNRLIAALRFLSESFHGQIIIFTCQSREETALSSAEIAHRSIRLPA